MALITLHRPPLLLCTKCAAPCPRHPALPALQAGGFVRDNRINGALNVSRTLGDLDFKRNTDLPATEQMVSVGRLAARLMPAVASQGRRATAPPLPMLSLPPCLTGIQAQACA